MCMSDNYNLSDRKREILLNSVGNYIDNAMPITSGSVQSNAFNTLSSATLRNELNALEEMGYLKQLHTSGGRIPTSKGYKYYVDSLLKSRKFDSKVVDDIKNKFVKRSNFILDVVDGLAKNVSDVLKLPTFIEMQNADSLCVKGINIIPLITGQALILVQTDAGIINNTINLPDKISEENCKDASKFLTTNLFNKPICDIISNFDYYNKLFKNQIKYFQEFFEFIKMGLKVNKNIFRVIFSYFVSKKKEKKYNLSLNNREINTLKSNKLKILIVSHPYVVYDDFLGGNVIRYLKENGIDVLYSDRMDRKESICYAKEISDTLYWLYSKENIGSIVYYKDAIDGIIFLSSFPCGPDSLVNELLIRKMDNIPVINIILDESTATSGLYTRLESFIDIIKVRRENG